VFTEPLPGNAVFKYVAIYVPRYIKIDAGVQAILMFSFKNLRDCNIGITDEGTDELCR
jgi:hypothetical protein